MHEHRSGDGKAKGTSVLRIPHLGGGSIGRRYAIAVLVFALLVTLISSLLQFNFEHHQNTVRDFALIFAGNGAKIFLLAAISLIIFDRLILRHLRKLAEAVHPAGTVGRDASLTLDRGSRKPGQADEFDQLAQAFDLMRTELAASFGTIEESERYRRAIIERAGDGIFVFSAAGRIVDANEAACRLLGYSRLELLDRLSTDLGARYSGSDLVALLESIENGLPLSLETELKRKDGTVFPVELSVVAADLHDRRHFIVVTRDITERKAAEAALRLSEAKFRDLVEGSIQGTVIHRGFQLLFANLAAAKMLGYETVAEMMALDSYLDIIMPDERERITAYKEARMKGEPAPSSYEYRGLRKNGSAIWLENRVSVVDWEGEPAILSVIVDISERHQVEAALRESEHMLAEAQRVGNMGHWRISVEPRGLQWSDEVFRIYGLDRETTVLTRELILPLHLPEEVNDYIQARDAAISGAAELSTEFRIRRPDGEIRKVTMIGQPELDDRGKVVALFGTVQDVTEQRQLQEQLVRSQKMEAIGQLTGGVAHDFNNLLAIVLGQSELMQYRQGKGDQRGAIDVIVRAAKRGAELTQRLLAFSRQQMLDPKIIDIDDLLPGIVALLRRTLGETIEVETGDTSELWHCEVDPGQLENALLNLAINARDAMPDGGKLTIEASNAVVEDSAVSAEPDVSPGSYVVLAVSDQGHGIASDHLEHVFEPFFTTKEVGSGSGLGLSMVYGFAQQSGGHATVTSEVGKGTTVKIYLPRAALQPDAREAGLPQAENLSGDETILVVEDDADVRYMTVALLETLGFSTIEAGDGAQALGLLESDASVDLLLTDIVLPGGMLGLELARRVTDLAPGTKVLFMSGYSEYLTLESGDQSHKLGADVPLLPKPFDRTKLARMVRAALDD